MAVLSGIRGVKARGLTVRGLGTSGPGAVSLTQAGSGTDTFLAIALADTDTGSGADAMTVVSEAAIGYTSILVTALYQTPNGRPAEGTVIFTLTAAMRQPGQEVAATPVQVELSGAGVLVTHLMANDDLATIPVNTFYIVEEHLGTIEPVTYGVRLSKSIPWQDLSSAPQLALP
jgi:hypothetical protein